MGRSEDLVDSNIRTALFHDDRKFNSVQNDTKHNEYILRNEYMHTFYVQLITMACCDTRATGATEETKSASIW